MRVACLSPQHTKKKFDKVMAGLDVVVSLSLATRELAHVCASDCKQGAAWDALKTRRDSWVLI